MEVLLLSGRPVADSLLESLKADIKKLDPKLVVVQVGDDPASASYIKQKLKSCEAVKLRHEHRHLPEATTLKELMNKRKRKSWMNFLKKTTKRKT